MAGTLCECVVELTLGHVPPRLVLVDGTIYDLEEIRLGYVGQVTVGKGAAVWPVEGGPFGGEDQTAVDLGQVG